MGRAEHPKGAADTYKDWGDAMDWASAPSKEIQIIVYSSPGDAPAEDEPSSQLFFCVLILSISPFQYFCLLKAVRIKSYLRNILELIFLSCWEDTETESLCWTKKC